ncbi:MAG: adenylate kinase [Bacillota bacterium]|nr:adenylate kinase [Bacillota bacterium]
MQIILLGKPGAGKGTQAERLAQEAQVAHIATGDMFRAAVRDGTELGKLAQSYMERGALVPDDVTIGLMRERLAQEDAGKGFVLDGFPRNEPQAQALQGLLQELGRPIQAAVELEVPDEEILRRITGRRVCPQCGATYHVEFQPPKVPGICDRCGHELTQREDEKEETVRKRLEVYRQHATELARFYEARGVYHRLSGLGSEEEVLVRIRHLLQTLGVWAQ